MSSFLFDGNTMDSVECFDNLNEEMNPNSVDEDSQPPDILYNNIMANLSDGNSMDSVEWVNHFNTEVDPKSGGKDFESPEAIHNKIMKHLIDDNTMDSVEWLNNYNKEGDTNSGEIRPQSSNTIHNNIMEYLVEVEEQEALENYKIETKEVLGHLLGLKSDSEYSFIEAIERFKNILKSQVKLFSGKHLKEVLTKDLLFITINYKRIGIVQIEKYLDIMSDILVFFCDVIRLFFMSLKYFNLKIIRRESRRMKILLRVCLFNKFDKIMHILLEVKIASDIVEHQVLWVSIFRYFLVKISKYQNKDDIVRGFIIFQRLKETRPKKEWPIIESYMYALFDKSKRDLKKIPILNEILNSIENDPLYSVKDMCKQYNRFYKKKPIDNMLYCGENQKSIVKTDLFDINLKERFNFSQMFFSATSRTPSRFLQILAERKPGAKRRFLELDGLRKGRTLFDSYDCDVFGRTRSNSKSSKSSMNINAIFSSRNSPIIILDDDSDDDVADLDSEDIKTITIFSDSDNSKSSFCEDLKTILVGETVEISAQVEKKQESSVTNIAEMSVKDSFTGEQQSTTNLDSINSDSSDIVQNKIDKPAENNQSPVKDKNAPQNAQLPITNNSLKDDTVQLIVNVGSINELPQKVDNKVENDTSTLQISSINNMVLALDDLSGEYKGNSSDKKVQSAEKQTQTQIEENTVHGEVNDTFKTSERNHQSIVSEEAVHVESNYNNNNNALVEETTVDHSQPDNSASNKLQNELSSESFVQAECTTIDNNSIENRLTPDRQNPPNVDTFSHHFNDTNLDRGKTQFEEFEFNSNRLETIDAGNSKKIRPEVIKLPQLKHNSNECMSHANNEKESLGRDADNDINIDIVSHNITSTESRATLNETSSDISHIKSSLKLTELDQPFIFGETDALPLSNAASVITAKNDETLPLKQYDQQVLLYTNCQTMPVSDSLIIDNGSARESTSALSELKEARLPLFQTKISSGDSSLTVPPHACSDCPLDLLTMPISSSVSQRGHTSESGKNLLKVQLPLGHCTETLENLSSTTVIKSISKEQKSLKRRKSSTKACNETKRNKFDMNSNKKLQNKTTAGCFPFQQNREDTYTLNMNLFNYDIENSLHKTVSDRNDPRVTWLKENDSRWNTSMYQDFDTNKTHIPDTQLWQNKNTVYSKTQDLNIFKLKKSKNSTGTKRATFPVAKSAKEIQNELHQKEPSKYPNYNLGILSATNSNTANNSYYDTPYNQNNVFVSREMADINPNLLRVEKNGEFGAINRTLNDRSILVTSNSEDINVNNTISNILDPTTNVLLRHRVVDNSLTSGLAIIDEKAYFNPVLEPTRKKMAVADTPGVYEAQRGWYNMVQGSDQSYFGSRQKYSVPYYQNVTTPQESQTITSNVFNDPAKYPPTYYYQRGITVPQNAHLQRGITVPQNSDLPFIQPGNAFYGHTEANQNPCSNFEYDSRQTRVSLSNPNYFHSISDLQKACTFTSACSKSQSFLNSKIVESSKRENNTLNSQPRSSSSLSYTNHLEGYLPKTSSKESSASKKPSTYVSSSSFKTPIFKGDAQKSNLSAWESSTVFLPTQLGEMVQSPSMYSNSLTVTTASNLAENILKYNQLGSSPSAITYYSNHVPTLDQVSQNTASRTQTFLTDTVTQPSNFEEVNIQLPSEKGKMTDEEDVNPYLVLTEQRKQDCEISYPAKRQMSIADLQKDFLQFNTLMAQKMYPDRTSSNQFYYPPGRV